MKKILYYVIFIFLIFNITSCQNQNVSTMQENVENSNINDNNNRVERKYDINIPVLAIQTKDSYKIIKPMEASNESNKEVNWLGSFCSIEERQTVYLEEDDTLIITSSLNNLEYSIYNNDELDKVVYKDVLKQENIHLMDTSDVYLYSINGTYKNEEKNIEEIFNYQFFVKRNLLPKVTLSSNEVFPGDMFVIKIENVSTEDQIELNAPFTEYPVKFFPSEKYKIAYVTMPYSSEAGNVDFEILIKKGDVVNNKIPLSINVLNKEFLADYIYVNETLSGMRTDNNYAIMQSHIDEARSNPSEELYIDGPFIQPVEGRITTEYGQIRYVNDKLDSRHNGIDIAAPIGTEIKADQNGKVVLSMELPILGNTIIIDHGQNIFSAFYHMNELKANVGDMVSTGDVIGYVGTTGFSTGPHLHWCIWVNGSFTNPWQLIDSFEELGIEI